MNERASTTVFLAGRILPEGYASRLGQVTTRERMAQLSRLDPVMPEILTAERPATRERGTRVLVRVPAVKLGVA